MASTRYIYLTIPEEYICIYHKLLILVSNIGKEILNDCNASCKGNNKYIIDCWNTFQSAIACNALGKTKEAEILINYIKGQISNLYIGTDSVEQDVFVYIDDSYLKARVSCKNDIPIVDVDAESGMLYNVVESNDKELAIENENLIIKDK